MIRASFLHLTAIALLAGTACGPYYEPFDSRGHLESQIEARMTESGIDGRPAGLPFALDAELRALVEQRVTLAGGEEWRVDQILDLIFEHLDLEYALYPTRSATETFRAGEGNCLSFVNLFVGIARERKLNPFYVEVEDYKRWNYQRGSVISHGHIVAGMRVSGDLKTYDFLPYRAKSYRDFQPIDDLKATAHYYNNLGAEALLDGDTERAHELLRIAVALAPRFPKAVNNLGVSLLRMGRTEEALVVYRDGLEGAPKDVALLTNLGRLYQEIGEREKSEEMFARLEATNEASPYYYLYRGEMALADDDPRVALDYMIKALRLDTEIPEIHVGLAKVYLSLAELRKARHHLDRALSLDGSHREARRYARLLSDRESAPPSETGRRPSRF